MSQADNSEDLLSNLLAIAEKELSEPDQPKRLVDVDLFSKQNCDPSPGSNKKSIVHAGETDSSDDEENKYYENKKYNEYGREIKYLLESSATTKDETIAETTWKSPPKIANMRETSDVYTDPVFGIRIVKPLISSTVLKERMIGRQAVPMCRIKKFTEKEKIDIDWVVAGVIVNKIIKTATSGNQYCIWTLSDLHGDLKTVCLFLFGNAYKEFWKTTIGIVVGVLNPTVFESKAASKDEVSCNVIYGLFR